ncbi:MAG: YceI family protein [Candidatus Dormibacteria bacterium]|jgi:polyisoprenoid-binding protein YceI
MTQPRTATRTPLAAGEYVLEPSHTQIGFVARHLVFTKVRGTFEKFESKITVGEDLETSGVEVSIDIASINTRDAKRDAHLGSADFFDAEKYQTMTFRSTGVEAAGEARFAVTGDLTIRDQTHPVTLDVQYLGTEKTPWGSSVSVVSASAEIDREAWGLTYNAVLESGGVMVSKTIQLEIEAEIVPAALAAAA